MIIRSLDKNYIVIRSVDGKGECRQFVCRDEDGKCEYRLVQVPAEKADNRFLLWLEKMRKHEYIKCLLDYFPDGDYLDVVTCSGTGDPLHMKLSIENCSLRERLVIGDRLMTELVLQDQPVFLRNSCLDTRLIRVTKAYDISFDYDLSDILNYEKTDPQETFRLLSRIMIELFEQELSDESFPDIAGFIMNLDIGTFTNIIDAHKEYRRIFNVWVPKEADEIKPDGFMFRLWERIKQCLGLVKKLVLVAILIGAVIYLVISIKNFSKVPEPGKGLSRIGLLEIKEQEDK